MAHLRLTRPTGPFDLALAPPGSKSLTNRAMVLAALSDGRCELSNALFADDTRVMIEALRAMGFAVEADEAARRIAIDGAGGTIRCPDASLHIGNSGTTIRFLTALASLGRGTFRFDGIARMRQRPIGPLVEMLRNLGSRVRYLDADGFPPVEVLADGLPGGLVRYGSESSSQFLSALLHVAPYARHEVKVRLEGRQTSWPYVEMTMRLMDHFGHFVELERDPETHEPSRIVVPTGRYLATDYVVEPDASNASYFLAAAAALPGSRIRIDGLGRSSLQGDVRFTELLKQMGAWVKLERDHVLVEGPDTLEGIDADFSSIPDTAQTFAVLACLAEGSSTLRGLHTLRVKETDRVAALQNELAKLGAEVELDGDDLTIHPPEKLKIAAIDTYDDHRMAMSFSVASMRVSGLVINDPQCVNKTYPGFFDDLPKLGVGVDR
jgi:3-phosphoshikimate 1-carboxyvinyltransferase